MLKGKKHTLFTVLLLVAVSFSGCEVFVDFGLKSSTFEMYAAIIPGSETNLNTLLLPGYIENDPQYRYIVKYHNNDRCTGEYYAADTLQ